MVFYVHLFLKLKSTCSCSLEAIVYAQSSSRNLLQRGASPHICNEAGFVPICVC
jgi:hypothetical protein